VNEHGVKKQLCFLLPMEKPEAARINGIIEMLIAEGFLKSLTGSEKK
jgi:hypothetical protein